MIQGILLAAGRSIDADANNLTLALPDGTPVAVAAVRAMCAVLADVIVVVRADDQELPALLTKEGVHVVACDASDLGMGYSIGCGVRASMAAQGWVIALADMPYVSPRTIGTVAQCLERGVPIAAPVYRGRRGHPVGFSREFLDSLLHLHKRARDIIDANRDRVHLFEVTDQGVVVDVDSLSEIEEPA